MSRTQRWCLGCSQWRTAAGFVMRPSGRKVCAGCDQAVKTLARKALEQQRNRQTRGKQRSYSAAMKFYAALSSKKTNPTTP